LVRAAERGIEGGRPLAPKTRDVLDDDNGVVDQQSERDHEAHDAELV
jgi:hypothetical protein